MNDDQDRERTATKVVIAGAAGRMGQCLVRCADGLDSVSVCGAVEAPGHAQLGTDSGVLAGVAANGVPLQDDPAPLLGHADVLIDFSFHEAVPGHVDAAARAGCAVVLGTTGLTEPEQDAVRCAARKVAVVWAPNMSRGVNLLFWVVERAARVLGPQYSVSIEETHHVHKKDAPSGTALRLGERVAEGSGRPFDGWMLHMPGDAEPPPDVSGRLLIRSHREGQIVGDHAVCFENDVERITFAHSATSREMFAAGALKAAEWVAGRVPGLYDMQDVLGL